MNEQPVYRPPAEAYSLILRVAEGCPHNRCHFCAMYRDRRYRPPAMDEVLAQLETLNHPERVRRVFLADGDVMFLETEPLMSLLTALRRRLPRLARVNTYANGRSVLRHSPEALAAMQALGLNTLYMGLESGSNEVLAAVGKQDTAEEMTEACHRAAAAGLKMSVMILTGLGGRERRAEHTAGTIRAVNAMQPRLLSALRVIPVPGTPLEKACKAGTFQELSEHESVEELRDMLRGFELRQTVFRADHSSNILPLEARFPRDRESLVTTLNGWLQEGRFDRSAPAAPPLFL